MQVGNKPRYVNSAPSEFMKSIDKEQEEKRKSDAIFRNERETADAMNKEKVDEASSKSE